MVLEQAKLLVEQERRLSMIEDKLDALQARVETHPEGSYTIAGYASLRGLRVDINRANMLGRKAARLSRE